MAFSLDGSRLLVFEHDEKERPAERRQKGLPIARFGKPNSLSIFDTRDMKQVARIDDIGWNVIAHPYLLDGTTLSTIKTIGGMKEPRQILLPPPANTESGLSPMMVMEIRVYSIPTSDVYHALASRPQGLTGLEAAEQLKRIGANTIRMGKLRFCPLFDPNTLQNVN